MDKIYLKKHISKAKIQTDFFMKERSHFECKFCNCIVTTDIELKENLVLVHEGEKSFECKIFKMRITRHSELNVHIVLFMKERSHYSK